MTDTTANPAAALLAANRRRRRIRRWIAIGTLPLTLAALLLVGKMLSMYAFAHQSITAYVVDDYAGSESAARGQEFLNWFEPAKAPYNVGTALAGAERLSEARTKLEEALPLAHGLEVCAVRINLAFVIERMGDAARAGGDGAGAASLYGDALTVTIETPDECRTEQAQQQSPDPERDMEGTLDEAERRLTEKQKQEQQPPPPPEEQPQPDQEPQPSEDELQELQDKLDQGTQERDQQQDGDDPGGSGTDKPW